MSTALIDQVREDVVSILDFKALLQQVENELHRQELVHGRHDHPLLPRSLEKHYRSRYTTELAHWRRANAERDRMSDWSSDGILLEEVFEALSESDPAQQVVELVQVAATAVAASAAVQRRIDAA